MGSGCERLKGTRRDKQREKSHAMRGGIHRMKRKAAKKKRVAQQRAPCCSHSTPSPLFLPSPPPSKISGADLPVPHLSDLVTLEGSPSQPAATAARSAWSITGSTAAVPAACAAAEDAPVLKASGADAATAACASAAEPSAEEAQAMDASAEDCPAAEASPART
eukprot:scaffold564_cov101-Isochrysis_galbana.AAC.6